MRPSSEYNGAEDRPDPDALLVAAAREDDRRGHLEIFFGAAPSVGRTYAMLEAARKTQAAGGEVVVGLVETHDRQDDSPRR